ncbi:MAG: transcriptional repressor [Candidatus Xiphinematobacter sp.]|nr:MAG: transcriptional repressor [Candidatus Xiphinematobacter sp.]QQY09355.1 MAG: transcriptional repressor [Candidatus Xiphinematobacter sp.]QQY10105.1 MAG: transcriptional repressor [Candidatus Xiphinematobacter sp.]QQY10840.1 MAG: transcriptional repressor [Candidatus Xiphinematobacter sp.]QQY11584.1 MAG: transcriptional repressor [Candidatus Xiphinematobacter sp.]
MNLENRKQVCAAARKFLESKGLRQTSQRNAIIRAAFSTSDHFSAEGLLRMAKEIDFSVSRATVYRTLPLLTESGLLRGLDLGNGVQYYDPNFIERPIHNHLICVDCNKITEFEDINTELLKNRISRRLGFFLESKVLRIEGHCKELRLRGNCPKRRE